MRSSLLLLEKTLDSLINQKKNSKRFLMMSLFIEKKDRAALRLLQMIVMLEEESAMIPMIHQKMYQQLISQLCRTRMVILILATWKRLHLS